MQRHRLMKRLLGTATWLVLAGVLGMLPGAPALAADQPALQAIDVQPLAGQQLQLTMRLSGPAPQPLSFTIDNPARISLDLPNTTLALPSRRIDVHASGLDTILAAETKDRTRLVLNMDKLVPYDTRVEGNSIIVLLGGGSIASATSAAPTSAPQSSSSSGGTRELRSIDFRRSADGAGRVIVKLSDPHTHINLHQVGSQIVVDFTDAGVPGNLVRRYDATDYGTPVNSFDVTRAGNGARIAIAANGDFEQLAYQSDDQYVVEVAPRHKAANAPEDKPVYTGERLTLNFQDIETRAVLQLLADASGQNIVVSDSVNGNVTLRLQNVPGTRRSTSCCAPRASTSAARTTSSSWRRRPSLPPARRRSWPRGRTCRSWRRCAPSTCRSTTRRPVTSRRSSSRRATAACCPSAAPSPSTSAPTRCC